MSTLEQYRRRLGYQPWAAFQLDRMHENCLRVQEHGFRSTDCLFRRTGRTTRGLLGYIAANHASGRIVVMSNNGYDATRLLLRRCIDLVEMLEVRAEVTAGEGGYVDYYREYASMNSSTMSLLHAEDGVSHNWNVYERPGFDVTCLTCLAIGPLPPML